MNSDTERCIRFQFWISNHAGDRLLWQEWSDGEIEEADIMLPDRIVDLQQWDAGSDTVWNHLPETGWEIGSVPFCIDPDAPVPEIGPDYETLPLQAQHSPEKLQEALQRPKTAREPQSTMEAKQTPTAPPQELGSALRAVSDAPKFSGRCSIPLCPRTAPERTPLPRKTHPLLWALCGSVLCGSMLLSWLDNNASSNVSASSSRAAPRPSAAPTREVSRPVTENEVPVRRALLVRLPTH